MHATTPLTKGSIHYFFLACQEHFVKFFNFFIIYMMSIEHRFEAGVDVKCLSAILGHSSVRVTLDIYVHPTLEMKRKSMAKIGEA